MIEQEAYKNLEVCSDTDLLIATLMGLDLADLFSSDMTVAWPLAEKAASLQIYPHTDYEWRGPLFKSDSTYLTYEGYGIGDVCWYVRIIVCGCKYNVVADTPALAVCRALFVLHEAMQEEIDRINKTLSTPQFSRYYDSFFLSRFVQGLFPDIDRQLDSLSLVFNPPR